MSHLRIQLSKPTLKTLEQKFEQNQTQRETARQRIHTAIEWSLAGRAPNWEKFKEALEKKGIALLEEKDKGRLFFVDHVDKTVFSGKNLNAGYDLETLRNRCAPEEQQTTEQIQTHRLNLHI